MKPVIVFSAVPLQKVSFKEFFGNPELHKLLENPGELRHAGWDLQTRERVHVGEEQCLEIGLADYKLIQLYEDGTLLARAVADNSLLGWGNESREFSENPRLNSIALIEFAYNFVLLYQRLTTFFEPAPQTIRLGVRIEGAWSDAEGNAKLYLSPYGVKSAAWQFGTDKHQARSSTGKVFVDVPFETLRAKPGRATFLLVERIYAWFDFTSDKVPYADEQEGERVISPVKITEKQ